MIATHQFLTDRPKIEYYGWQLDFPPGVSKINMYNRSHNITSHQNTSPHVSISAKRQYYRIFCAPILLLTMLRGVFVDIGRVTNNKLGDMSNVSLGNLSAALIGPTLELENSLVFLGFSWSLDT